MKRPHHRMASRIDSKKLSSMIKSKRGKQGLRAAGKEIGISAPTLSRIEQGNLPDIETYVKLCEWLKVPTDYFTTTTEPSLNTQDEVVASLRADKTLPQETVESIVNFINLAYKQVKTSNRKD